MSSSVSQVPAAGAAHRGPQRRDLRRSLDRFGDALLFAACALAALLAVGVLLGVGYEIVHKASPSISKFGAGFIFHTTWQPNPPFEDFGAGTVLFGTMVSSF